MGRPHRGHTISCHRIIGECSLVPWGPRVPGPGLTWGPTVQQLHKVGWEGSQLTVLLPQPPAVLNLGRGGRRDIWFCPQESLENLYSRFYPKPTLFCPSLPHLRTPHPFHLPYGFTQCPFPKASNCVIPSPPLLLPQSPQRAASARLPAPGCS